MFRVKQLVLTIWFSHYTFSVEFYFTLLWLFWYFLLLKKIYFHVTYGITFCYLKCIRKFSTSILWIACYHSFLSQIRTIKFTFSSWMYLLSPHTQILDNVCWISCMRSFHLSTLKGRYWRNVTLKSGVKNKN